MVNTIADLAWAAGIVDGEGCICITKQTRQTKGGFSYHMFVSVKSSDTIMTTELQKLFPEITTMTTEAASDNQTSDQSKWRVNGKKALVFLKQILPFLKVKKEQALLAIQFQEETKRPWRDLSESDKFSQEQYYLDLKQAKQDLKIGINLRKD